MSFEFWRGKRVFLTGHTGFKGGWLSLWLTKLGAEVHGYALLPPTDPNFFTVTRLEDQIASSTIADIRDVSSITRAMAAVQPEIVLHLAAQSLVRYSYVEPIETFTTNVMGTVNLLEAVRQTPSVKAVLVITSDKCYENRERSSPYRENEALGGHDPYSSSKACAELVTAAWRRSFFGPTGVAIASARSGNVIGGGDWAADRLVPDFLRALEESRPLAVRAPLAIRPWQHVLEPLSGYLTLAERLCNEGASYAEAWNFGPNESDIRPVQWLVETLCASVSGAFWEREETPQPHEAQTLRLDSTKAREQLGWRTRWSLRQALTATLGWHQAWRSGKDMAAHSFGQLVEYMDAEDGE